MHDAFASLARPVKELKGFRKVWLTPGESERIAFKLVADQLAFYDLDMNLAVEQVSLKSW